MIRSTAPYVAQANRTSTGDAGATVALLVLVVAMLALAVAGLA